MSDEVSYQDPADRFRAALVDALGLASTPADDELIAFARQAIEHARAAPPPARSGESVTVLGMSATAARVIPGRWSAANGGALIAGGPLPATDE